VPIARSEINFSTLSPASCRVVSREARKTVPQRDVDKRVATVKQEDRKRKAERAAAVQEKKRQRKQQADREPLQLKKKRLKRMNLAELRVQALRWRNEPNHQRMKTSGSKRELLKRVAAAAKQRRREKRKEGKEADRAPTREEEGESYVH